MPDLRSTCLVVSVLAACGGSPPSSPDPKFPIAPHEVTCAEAAAATPVDAKVTAFQGADGMAAWRAMVRDSCTWGHWPQPVIDCAAKTPEFEDKCFAQMPKDMVDNHSIRADEWAGVWQPDCHALDRGFGADAWTVPTALFAPRLSELPGELDIFAHRLRQSAFTGMCDDLGLAARRCFAAAKTSDQLAACRAKLPAKEGAALDAAIARSEAVMAGLHEVYRDPKRLECDAIVAAHYGDAAWTGRFTKLPTTARKSMIDDSRARLRDACPTMAKSTRACLALPEEQAYPCSRFDPATFRRGSAGPAVDSTDFTYPASGVVFATGAAECEPYAAAARAASKCTKLPEATRNAIAYNYTRFVRDIDDPSLAESVKFSCPGHATDVGKQLADAGCK